MRVTILGSGTSHGVPMIGCDCGVCHSDNPKNRRMRPSILVENEGRVILVDTTPELRLQAIDNDVRRVDAVFITHTHADHIFGLDELRRFNDLIGDEIPVYGDEGALDDIRRIYQYIFMDTQAGGGKPRITLHPIPERFSMFGLDIRAFKVMHGELPIRAFRFDNVAYVTDVNQIPEAAMTNLRELDLLIIDAVRPKPHSTHFGLYQALDVINELKPKRALLTHLSHQMDHDAINAELPANVELAWDGLTLDF